MKFRRVGNIDNPVKIVMYLLTKGFEFSLHKSRYGILHCFSEHLLEVLQLSHSRMLVLILSYSHHLLTLQTLLLLQFEFIVWCR